jgi:hypothetical protein
MKWFSARWFKITASIFSFLLIAAPAAFSVWWYMFSSTPPYQWFKEHGLPHWMNNALWAVLVMPVIIGLVLLVLIWRGLSSRSEATVKTELSKEPKLTITCGPIVEGSVAQAWWTINGEPTPVNFFRVVVNATEESQLVKNCTGFLTRIEKDGKTKWGGNNAQLTFAQGEEPDALSKTIRYPVPEYLDVLAVTSRNQIFPGTKPGIGLRLWPFVPALDQIFSQIGDYLLTVVITGDGVVPAVTALLKFTWLEDLETAALTLIPESRPDDPYYVDPPSEIPQLKARREKLKNLLDKKERLATAKSSPGFDMDAARRRNEKFIAEVRADIERLEGERSKPVAIITESSPKGFQIEALPPVPDVLNLTQHTWHEGAKIMFTGDAVLGVTNRLLAQGIDLVSFRLLSISPPMKALKAHKPSTLDAALKRIDFSEDIPATLVAGKTNDVRLFKATRPFSANSLKDISIEFYGNWPEGYYSVFTPSERHELTVEVTGKGVSREEATFQLRFSYKETEPVFSIKTIRAAVGRA